MLRDGDHLGLTRAGLRQVGFVSSLVQDWVVDKLARSPGFEGRPDRAEVSAALERIARRALIDPDDAGESAEFAGTAHS
nr:drug transporter [Mycolicibacter nonchromogenicus]